ncbi:hypothetical protein [Dyella sp.]|uniref:hypothetical protein n=1 Tax=Dyella sp. TaxID=1869338 RepID=UPI003F811BD9
MVIAGVPAMDLRKALRKLGKWGAWDVASLAEALGIDEASAAEALSALVAEGYVEVSQQSGCPYYATTVKGNALALASSRKPIKRAAADRIVQEAIARVEAINASPEFAYGIRKLIVFGSYLTDQAELGDVDLALELVPRFNDTDQQTEIEHHRVEEARRSGKRLRSFMDRLAWPMEEIFQIVKGGRVAISLHPSTDAVLTSAQTKILLASDKFPIC